MLNYHPPLTSKDWLAEPEYEYELNYQLDGVLILTVNPAEQKHHP